MTINNDKRYLELYASSAIEAIALLLELRKHHFFSFRGQRNRQWPLGSHGIPAEWATRDAALTDEDYKIMGSGSVDTKDYRRSKSVRAHISADLSLFVKQCRDFGDKSHFQEGNWWSDLIFARHHGLKTLLLDWTSNPLVALYFAVENVISMQDDTVRGAVYAIKVRSSGGDAERRWYDVNELRIKFPRGEFVPQWIMINPPLNSQRIIRQSGKFSYHPSITDQNLIDATKGRLFLKDQGEALVKIIIGNSESGDSLTRAIRYHLGIMNVHHGSLFQDYDGVAQFINNEWPDIGTKPPASLTSLAQTMTPNTMAKLSALEAFISDAEQAHKVLSIE